MRPRTDDKSLTQPDLVFTIPTAAKPHQRAAMVLATLGAPPTRLGDESWQKCYFAFCRLWWHEYLQANSGWNEPVPAGEMSLSVPEAEIVVSRALDQIRRGQMAAFAHYPLFHRASELAAGQRVFGPAPGIEELVNPVLSLEEELAPQLDARSGSRRRSKAPEFLSRSALVNFRSRFTKPALPVLHLHVAFLTMLKKIDDEVGASALNPRRWITAEGRAVEFQWMRLIDFSDHLDKMVELGAELEKAVPHLEMEGKPSFLVRLRAEVPPLTWA